MQVTSQDKKLEAVLTNSINAFKEYGKVRAKTLLRRIQTLIQAPNLECTRCAPGHFHELVGDRKGQWACDIDQPYRLIFEPHEKPIPSDPNGKYIWIEIKGVELIEITNYHGK